MVLNPSEKKKSGTNKINKLLKRATSLTLIYENTIVAYSNNYITVIQWVIRISN